MTTFYKSNPPVISKLHMIQPIHVVLHLLFYYHYFSTLPRGEKFFFLFFLVGGGVINREEIMREIVLNDSMYLPWDLYPNFLHKTNSLSKKVL